MKVALIQMASSADKARNLRRAAVLCERAFRGGARFVLLPEYFYFRGRITSAALRENIVESVDGPTVNMFSLIARRFQGYLLLGSIYERSSDPRKSYNTAILLSPSGKVIGKYRKQNLFHVRLSGKEVSEAKIFKPGRRLSVVRVEDLCLGTAVCFDLRFPDIFERSARRGANVFAVPSCFSYATGQAHWEVLLRARAAETFSYVLAPNQAGMNAEGLKCWGHSMVIDPWGKVLAEGSSSREEIVCADIQISEIRKRRRMFPEYKNLAV